MNSDRFNWASSSVAWTIDSINSISFVGGGSIKENDINSFAAPLVQNNSQIYDLIYTYSSGALTLTPYFQYTRVGAAPAIGLLKAGGSYGVALLGNYNINDNFSLGARAEYLKGDGSQSDPEGTNVTFYGPGSRAYSFTLTPNYKWDKYFVRAEGSFTGLDSATPGDAFGTDYTKQTQARALIEAGVLF